jgi:hypothetical protein
MVRSVSYDAHALEQNNFCVRCFAPLSVNTAFGKCCPAIDWRAVVSIKQKVVVSQRDAAVRATDKAGAGQGDTRSIERGLKNCPDRLLRALRASGDEQVLNVIAEMLDPQGTTDLRLKCGRRRRGRPLSSADRDAEIAQDIEASRISCGGKLEAALAEVGKRRGISRSTLLAAWKRYKASKSIGSS